MPGRTQWWSNYLQHLDDRFEARINDKLKNAAPLDYTSFLAKFPMYKRDEDDLGEQGEEDQATAAMQSKP